MATRHVHIVVGDFVHTFYREQLCVAPAGYSYDLEFGARDLHPLKSDLLPHVGERPLSRLLRQAIQALRANGRIPNVRLPLTECSLIHSFQYPLITRTNWVVDFEDIGAMVGYYPLSTGPALSRSMLMAILRQPQCRWLLPWTRMAEKSLSAELGDSLLAKTRVVSPAIRPKRERARQPLGKATSFLFVGSRFLLKGGCAALRAFQRLRSRYPDVRLTMVTQASEEHTREALRIGNVEILTAVSPAELDRLYRTSTVLLAPFTTDTLGFVVLEAKSYGLPAIVSHNFALPELVGDGASGLVVPWQVSAFDSDGRRRCGTINEDARGQIIGDDLLTENLLRPPATDVEGLAMAMQRVVEEPQIAGTLGECAYQDTVDGTFSHPRRAQILKELYDQALNETSD